MSALTISFLYGMIEDWAWFNFPANTV